MALAIAPPHVTYVPGIGTKRFAREIAQEAERADAEITEGQASYLREVVVRFRRQIPREVVTLALDGRVVPLYADHGASNADVPRDRRA